MAVCTTTHLSTPTLVPQPELLCRAVRNPHVSSFAHRGWRQAPGGAGWSGVGVEMTHSKSKSLIRPAYLFFAHSTKSSVSSRASRHPFFYEPPLPLPPRGTPANTSSSRMRLGPVKCAFLPFQKSLGGPGSGLTSTSLSQPCPSDTLTSDKLRAVQCSSSRPAPPKSSFHPSSHPAPDMSTTS
jgi:hypothetical protein